VPLSEKTERKAATGPASTTGQSPKQAKRGRPARGDSETTRLHVDVRDDGTVKVVLESGRRSDTVADVLGLHRLW
jgi:hypothetical protein